MSHHRVSLDKAIDDAFDLGDCLALCLGQLLDVFLFCRDKLMKRWIQQTDRHRACSHHFVQLLKVTLLEFADLLERFLALLKCIGADHFTECVDTVALKEHVLGTAQADALCTQLDCFHSIHRCVGICADLHRADLIRPFHDHREIFVLDGAFLDRKCAVVDITCRAVEGDHITSFVSL